MLARRILGSCSRFKPQLACATLQLIRYQSKKPDISDISKINDPKLREIIEGTNFGTEAILKKKREEEDRKRRVEEERKKLEQELEVQRKREEREAEKEKEQQRLEALEQAKRRQESASKADSEVKSTIRTTESGKLQGVDTDTHETVVGENDEQVELTIENQIIATSKGTIDESDIPNLAREMNETIQKEIGGLPSQKAKRQSELAKKLTKYLDSAHDTILTATRALNDVTGYSAIEKLKKSIEVLEDDLKKAKEKVKKCKAAYGEAIQRRSQSQREVNELLTRKHNWSSNDLERFTELYRNDHENERLEHEAERNLDEMESKVDAIQLKLTQSILTRYHEEQIWSDKIRRSSTWGTWILMGINVMLFVVATLIVEPWKRKKLVHAFEDKVKQVLVGISQNDEVILEPILEKLEPSDGKIDIKPVTTPAPAPTSTPTPPPTPKESYRFKFLIGTWHEVKESVIKSYNALVSPDVKSLEFDKFEFEIFAVTLTVVALSIGSIITSLFK
ncbi:hypothetical protein G210_0138 [Candida maltosa Xu316]|uniref:Sensitive to high expression protein 9, mitochondrial n=1 Tax=Candida maltosa (strain Xu316) TaxID=1245528 RepID=M3K7P9_CANMX|nr:hypothetical protein G210_0138 [Candida maltosa Xu316]